MVFGTGTTVEVVFAVTVSPVRVSVMVTVTDSTMGAAIGSTL